MTANRIVPIKTVEDIPAAYRGTPVELLIRYQNFGQPHARYQLAQILIGMCIDYRKHLNIPENFAYMIRSGGANLRLNEFKVSFAVAVGGVSTIALIGHTQCGMVNIQSKKEIFIRGLVERGGWELKAAEDYFLKNSPLFEIVNEADFVASEAQWLRSRYPKVLVAPMIYKVEDGLLYLVQDARVV